MTELAGLGTTHALLRARNVPRLDRRGPARAPRSGSRDPDDGGARVPPGEPGELMVRGPLVMLGYYGNDAATAEAIEPDGWLHTGDVATDGRRRALLHRRPRKDMIMTGGLQRLSGRDRAGARRPSSGRDGRRRRRPDAIKGELAHAYVVLRPGADGHARTRSSSTAGRIWRRTSCPASVRFVADLPKTSTGKIMRRALRQLD